MDPTAEARARVEALAEIKAQLDRSRWFGLSLSVAHADAILTMAAALARRDAVAAAARELVVRWGVDEGTGRDDLMRALRAALAALDGEGPGH